MKCKGKQKLQLTELLPCLRTRPEIRRSHMAFKPIDYDRLISGSIDMHLHPGPDSFKCRVDALEAANQAKQAGMKAIVIKNHFYPTAPIAMMVNQLVPDFKVFGSVCLDYQMGGLN